MNHVEPYGVGSYGKPTIITFADGAVLRVGKYCSIAGDVKIFLTAEHRTEWVTTYPFPVKMLKKWPEVANIKGHPWSKGDVRIKHDVWVGWGVTVLSGVTIKSGAVIGMGSVVTKDVEPYSIVAGNPAKHVGFRFGKETIDSLLRIKWWNWDSKIIRERVKYLCSPDVKEFIRRFGNE